MHMHTHMHRGSSSDGGRCRAMVRNTAMSRARGQLSDLFLGNHGICERLESRQGHVIDQMINRRGNSVLRTLTGMQNQPQ